MIFNLSTDDVLVTTSNPEDHEAVNDTLAMHFQLTPNIDRPYRIYLPQLANHPISYSHYHGLFRPHDENVQ